jgi:hypothetical protein
MQECKRDVAMLFCVVGGEKEDGFIFRLFGFLFHLFVKFVCL